MMKRILLTLCVLPGYIMAAACPVCEKQQPKILRGISHGVGPDSKWDYVIVWINIAIALLSLLLLIKWLIRPGERSETHIKRFILK